MPSRPDPAIELSDAEKRDLIALIQAGKPLPEKYRFVRREVLTKARPLPGGGEGDRHLRQRHHDAAAGERRLNAA